MLPGPKARGVLKNWEKWMSCAALLSEFSANSMTSEPMSR
jgi:hypothetical protein